MIVKTSELTIELSVEEAKLLFPELAGSIERELKRASGQTAPQHGHDPRRGARDNEDQREEWRRHRQQGVRPERGGGQPRDTARYHGTGKRRQQKLARRRMMIRRMRRRAYHAGLRDGRIAARHRMRLAMRRRVLRHQQRQRAMADRPLRDDRAYGALRYAGQRAECRQREYGAKGTRGWQVPARTGKHRGRLAKSEWRRRGWQGDCREDYNARWIYD